MISLNDVLLAMSNIPVDDPIAEIWGRGLQGGYKIIKYTGSLPITITADGNALLDYRIYGADGRVGVATENLLNPNIVDEEQEISIEGGTLYTLSRYISGSAKGLTMATYDENGNKLWETYLGTWYRQPIQSDANAVLLKVYIPATFKNAVSLVKGYESTPQSNPYPANYIPYGYKLPMKSVAPTIYGFHINPDVSDSYNCVTYLNDAVGMTPASMGSTAFNYGSWQNVFFMPKPCMLKFDGTVDYYLDPNDYSKKADGVTPSDYNNLAYQGNAMMEFPLIWYKYVQGAAEGEGYFYVSNYKVDDTYKCWSNMDCDGNIIEHFYMPIYNGCTYDGKMRSISGLKLTPWSTKAYSASAIYTVGDKVNYDGKMWQCTTAVEIAEVFDPAKWEQFAFNGNTTASEEIAQATANNITAKTEWYIDTWNDRVLINGLLVLISKSIDTQGTFGRGIDRGGQAAKESYVTGSLDDKGLFYGSTVNDSTAVKVFGMENWWGLIWHRTAGLTGGGANDTYLYKMTFSTADGSIADAYNTTGSGYLSVGGKPTRGGYIKKMQFGLFGFLPIEVGSYSTQYYKDYYYNGTGFAFLGGNAGDGIDAGAFCLFTYRQAEYRIWYIGATPSCKPLREKFSDKSGNAASLAAITPVYIGENQLTEGEYVSYGEQKIYRDVSGTLTPTDPPVSLPSIPTIDGTTIIDYDGTPKPSQMYVKYRDKSDGA